MPSGDRRRKFKVHHECIISNLRYQDSEYYTYSRTLSQNIQVLKHARRGRRRGIDNKWCLLKIHQCCNARHLRSAQTWRQSCITSTQVGLQCNGGSEDSKKCTQKVCCVTRTKIRIEFPYIRKRMAKGLRKKKRNVNWGNIICLQGWGGRPVAGDDPGGGDPVLPSSRDPARCQALH